MKPKHYSLTLSELRPEAPWTYQGQVEILIRVYRTTRIIVLNSHELKTHRAQVVVQNDADDDAVAHRSTQISLDNTLQRCYIHFDVDLEPSAHQMVLSLWFEGCMNTYMAGFYRSQYVKPNAEAAFMFSTQFEPSDARRAFPCFDEPASKATFDLQIEVPNTMTALSNMPVKASIPSTCTDEACTIVTFERTPRMSTYLLSWAIGHFEYVERILDRKQSTLPVRVYTTEGLSKHGNRGLQVACDVIDYFSKVCFPALKQDAETDLLDDPR